MADAIVLDTSACFTLLEDDALSGLIKLQGLPPKTGGSEVGSGQQ